MVFGIGAGIAMGEGFGVALENNALGIGTGIVIGASASTAVWISKRGNDADG